MYADAVCNGKESFGMERDTLRRLEMLNQLSLTEEQKDDVICFFDKREADFEVIDRFFDTTDVERMVHVMPIMTVVREDKEIKNFTRDQLQQSAPETTDGYWQVPRLVE